MSYIKSASNTLEHWTTAQLDGGKSRLDTLKKMKHTLDGMIEMEGANEKVEKVIVNGVTTCDC